MLIRITPQATDEGARRRLAQLVAERRENYAGLSWLIGRPPGYLARYVRAGTPKRLPDAERDMLAGYFAIQPQELGAPIE